MNRLKHLWSELRASFWFLPSLIVAFSTVMAVALIEVDSSGRRDWMAHWPRLFGAGAAGARGMLATIAGSMMTVVGVTFSMTLMTLALASSQYTSRILRNFMGDRVTQVVLGIFAGIFTYCLIVLRTIRGGDEGGFVPSLSVAFSVVLAIGGIGTLIFFIHHIASSIQASSIVASVTKETLVAVDRLFPEKLGREPMDDEGNPSLLPSPKRNWQAVMAGRNGYLQSVDNAALLRLAREHRTIVRMERGIGEFVVQNTPLASLVLENPPDQEIIAALRGAYNIDRHRTVHQDCAFGIRQLVDMALRALSPGINDTTTAVMCVDYLTAILARLASREIPSSRRYEDGELRVISVGQTFAGLVAEAFDEIRGSAEGNVAILLRMLGALQTIASLTGSPSRWRVLREQVEWIAEVAVRTIKSPHDRTQYENRLAQARKAVETIPPSTHACPAKP
ncbi:MAG: DUF2254 domain-containing protein [Verrucomicrobia bacterium]|nr:DUF2254 domain-containing protein [Verrucomicrobiota bacterium]